MREIRNKILKKELQSVQKTIKNSERDYADLILSMLKYLEEKRSEDVLITSLYQDETLEEYLYGICFYLTKGKQLKIKSNQISNLLKTKEMKGQ